MTMADEIAVMNEGRIEQAGSATELYETPHTEFVASFLGDCNLIDGSLGRRDASAALFETHDGARLRVPAERMDPSLNGTPVRVGVRPEKLTLLPADTAAPEGANVLRGQTPDSIGPGREVQLAWDPAHSIIVAKEASHAGS